MIKKDSIIKKIASYSALASCALIAGEANGQIVYHKLTPADTIPLPRFFGGGSYSLDLNGDGVEDFLVSVVQYDLGGGSYNEERFFARVYGAGNIDKIEAAKLYGSLLQNGQSIGENKQWKDSRGYALLCDITLNRSFGVSEYFTRGNWKNQVDKFVGLRIKNESTGDFNYGWLRLSVEFVNHDAGFMIVKDYAYQQTPNTPIIAGETGTNCLPVVSLSANGHKTIAPGDSVALHVIGFKKGDVVTWFRNGAILKSDSVSSLIVTEHGLYSALVENKKGCGQLTDSIQIKAVMPGMTTTEMNARSVSEIYVYNKTLVGKILSKDLSESTLSIYNELGQEVLKQNVNEDNFTINLESLSTGIYFVRLINNGTMMEKKIFVE
jgi:hypothetical protein